MDIDALQAFSAVAATNSFSRAASHLHLTQPAVSKRVAGLERELGSALFDRVGRNVTLTEAGRQLLPRAQQLLLDIADVKRQIANLSGAVSGTLAMGTSHHIGLHRLPPVLSAFARDYPEVRLDIRFMDSEVVCEAVAAGELELGVMTLPLEPPESLRLDALWEDPLELVVGRQHPLAGVRRPGLDRLLGHTAVLPAADTYTRAILREALGAREAKLSVAMSTNYLETLKMLAATGLGWTLLPRTMIDRDLRVLTVEGLALRRWLGIATSARRTLSNAAGAMIEACRAAS
jgi:DNA-binding transcriptional LysR family regulator